jgi:hypothetical protein
MFGVCTDVPQTPQAYLIRNTADCARPDVYNPQTGEVLITNLRKILQVLLVTNSRRIIVSICQKQHHKQQYIHNIMNNVIEKKDRKQITKDWLSFFTGFSEYKPMHLIRRNGVFLCGIHLQTHSGNWDYEMIFHIYNLMIDFPVISLSSDTFLLNHKGARDGATLSQHKEGFSNYAERLKQQVSLLQKDAVSCDELVAYIKETVNNSIGYPAESLRDIVLALFWCGKLKDAEKEISNSRKIISRWDNTVTQRFGGVDGWEKQVRELMNINTLKSTMEKQLQKFKLTNYYDYQLLCSSK